MFPFFPILEIGVEVADSYFMFRKIDDEEKRLSSLGFSFSDFLSRL